MKYSLPVRLAVCLLACLTLVLPLPATWSIVVVNTATGEVAVGTATCLTSFDIQKGVPVIVPGVGAGASQSLLDSGGINRKIIQRGLIVGLTPDQILQQLSLINGYQARQFGIVNLVDTPVTFTGNNASAAKGGVAGVVGDLRYAIQGNILTGSAVWLEAEKALVQTPGDLSQRLMAAMEAARAMGGDGRCSCSPAAPTSCGAPPVSGFTKSAHCAFVGVARIGDSLGLCNATTGCADGDYFLELNYFGGTNDPDPVLVLQGMYDAWRLGQAGLPDQVHSTVAASAQSLPADGQARLSVEIALADIAGLPLATGGAAITYQVLSGASLVSIPLPVLDHGDGTYSFEIQAGSAAGTDVYRLLADGVVLQPDVSVRVDPLAPLHLGFDAVSSSAGADVPITLNLDPALAGKPYHVLCSGSGTAPGTIAYGAAVPLNVDSLYLLSLGAPNTAPFLATAGLLDGAARAEATFAAPPGLLDPNVGGAIHWAVVVRTAPALVSGPLSFAVLP
jgi:hypothetical protein